MLAGFRKMISILCPAMSEFTNELIVNIADDDERVNIIIDFVFDEHSWEVVKLFTYLTKNIRT